MIDTKKFVSAVIGLATGIAMSGATMVMPLVAQADTTSDLQAQISSLLAQIATLQAQLSASGGTTTGTGYQFTALMKLGVTSSQVKELQKVLNTDPATKVASTGNGSSGMETTYFGSLTKAAVIKFQAKYGLTADGIVGAATRAKLNSLGGTTTGGGTTPTPTGGGIAVSTPAQPAASLAVESAARLPFTKVTLTAGSSDVTVNGIKVERAGLANDAVFAGVVLLDEDGTQIGIAKTFNSLHQATVGDAFVLKAGQSKTYTIAGNMAATLDTYAGEVAYLAVNGIDTTATVTGTFPITGAGQTINATLAIGTVTNARGPLDPNTTASKEVGTTGYTFSSVRFTAGSAEKLRVKSIRWNQSGSAASSDLANIKTYVDGVAYDTVVSSDGKYYTSTFGTGIVIDKGNSIEISIKGDIVGGSGRTIAFDLYKNTDVFITGETYGYGITPPTSGTGFAATNPWYDATGVVTVSNGSITVSKATSVGAQNIAVNLANQPLGGFVVEVKGEPISVASLKFTVSTTTSCAASTCLTNVSLFNEAGSAVAGPVDVGATTAGVLTFTDTVTFPIGKGTYTLKGKVGTQFSSNDTVYVSTTPSTQWTSITGQTTGNSITAAPTSAVAASTMTVKAGSLAISVSTVPLAQTVIAGASQFLFANYVFDAGSSGEDVSLSTFPVAYNATTSATSLTNCQLYDGSTSLTTGSNVKNPTANSSSTSFTFDTPLKIAKGTTKTIGLKCDVAGSTVAGVGFNWGYDATESNPTPTGVSSGQEITESETASVGQIMTVAASGTYTVVDDSTPGYSIVNAGATGVTLLKLKFAATTEPVDIAKVAFQLGSTASNTPIDLVGNRVTLWNGTTQIGEATFSTGDYATSTLIADGAFRVPSSGMTMTIKGDIAAIDGNVGPLTASGDLLVVAYDGNSNGLANGNYGRGVNSGSNITPTSGDVTATGVRIMKAYPTVAKLDLSTSERILVTGSSKTLYKFSITANQGDVYLYKTNFAIGSSTVSATTSAYSLYAYTDSAFSNADTTFSSDGLLNANSYYNGLGSNSTGATGQRTDVEIYMDRASATTTYKVPAGVTRYFALKGTVGNVETGTGSETVTVSLNGDAAYPVNASTLMNTAVLTDGDVNDDFIWSPNSTSSSNAITDLDFTNGYGVSGLRSTTMDSESLISAN